MSNSQNRGYQAWIWAIIINAALFGLVYVFVVKPIIAADTNPDNEIIADLPADDTGPGETFGQLTHLVDDTTPHDESTAAEPDIDESTAAEPDIEEITTPGEDIAVESPPVEETPVIEDSGSWEIPEDPDTPLTDPAAPETVERIEEGQRWYHNEFYLDRGELISFAPRLNTDGTLREQETVNGRPKAPTYEDVDETFDSDDHIPPGMEPSSFSSAELPDEYQDIEFDIRVRIHLDARGRVLGTPEFVRSSGYADVDRWVMYKILNDVSFEPARRKDTGEPKTVWVVQPIFFE